MKINTSANITHITQTDENTDDFLNQLAVEFHQFENNHLIVELSPKSFADIHHFYDLNDKHRAQKKSFVLVVSDIDVDAIDEDQLMVVPTLQEAHDVIEMEEIERDLGF